VSQYIAVDIGGTHLRAAGFHAGDLHPVRIARKPTQAPTIDPNPQPPFERLIDLIASIWPADEPVTVISVAAPGPVNPFTGVLMKATNIPGWVDMPLQQKLEKHFGVPVLLGNDANLAALGEWKFGAGRGTMHMVYLTISTGIGSGVIVDGCMLVGARGLAAEIGHITVVPDGEVCNCGYRGHLEAYASGTAIARWVEMEIANGKPSSLAGGKPISAKAVSNAALAGDPLSIAALERAGKYMGHALADILHIFNPSALVIGGGVSQSGPLLFEPMRKALQERVFNPHYLDDLVLLPAAFGDDAGLIGAFALGAHQFPPAA
jgi:glucokinase